MKQQIEAEFRNRFKSEPVIICAPGRINLLGEHLDYNNGLVLPTAIDKSIVFAIAPSLTDESTILALDYNETISFSTKDLVTNRGWVSYLMGVMQGFINVDKGVNGVHCVFGGNIPNGGGLSSSAALCCGFGFALNEVFRMQLRRIDIAFIAQFAEHEFAGVKCGLMDQYASLFSQRENVLLLDCRSLTHEIIPFQISEFEILLVDSKVKHELASTAYNQRRLACEEGVAVLKKSFEKIESLRDADKTQLMSVKSSLEEEVFTNCLYVLEEMSRVKTGVDFLRSGDLKKFGQLMYQSHTGLSKMYLVSCAELDFLVAMAADNLVAGSRMMGGGFGGCTINLIQKDKIEQFKALASEKYYAQFNVNPLFYHVKPDDGVHLVS